MFWLWKSGCSAIKLPYMHQKRSSCLAAFASTLQNVQTNYTELQSQCSPGRLFSRSNNNLSKKTRCWRPRTSVSWCSLNGMINATIKRQIELQTFLICVILSAAPLVLFMLREHEPEWNVASFLFFGHLFSPLWGNCQQNGVYRTAMKQPICNISFKTPLRRSSKNHASPPPF